jgi:hypothetical protein
MNTNKFINMIESDSLEMAKKWTKGLLKSKFTKTYRKLPEEKLIQLGKNVYDNLAKWLARGATKIEIGKIYAELGKERYNQGYPLCEVLYAAHYEKRILADHISSEGLLPDALNLYYSMDFLTKLYDFFDIATFYLTRGFQEALYKKATRLKGVDEKKIKEIFPPGSFYYEKASETEQIEKLLDGFNVFKMK